MNTLEMAFGLLGMIIFFSFVVVMRILSILSRTHIRHAKDAIQLKTNEKINDLGFKTQVVVHVTGSVKNSETAAQITHDIEAALKDIIKDIDVSVKVRVEKID
jgi:hypothetical protein